MKALTRYILSTFGGSVIIKDKVKEICKRFRANSESTINFMISYGYFIRILRGVYYVKTIEEFKLKKSIDIYRLISLGMEKIRVKWYFGLYTALKFNGATHEYFDTIFILNNKIFRPKEINIAKEKVRFLKLKEDLFSFGINTKGKMKFSDLEKTLLDMIYISKYRSVPEERIALTLKEYSKKASKKKFKSYLRFYPKSVKRVVKNAKFI